MTLAASHRATTTTAYPQLITDRTSWNSWIGSSPAGHILQSYEWGDCKRQSGWSAERIALLDDERRCLAAAQVLWRESPLGPIAYVPRGPVLSSDSLDAEAQLWSAIHRRLRNRRTICLRVEPNQAADARLDRLGFRRAEQVVQADVTIQVDLRPDLDTILAAAKPKTRYNVRLAQRRGVSVSVGSLSDLPDFYRLLVETSRRDRFFIRPYAYYQHAFLTLGDKARLLLAHHEGDLLAAALVTVFGSEAIYLYGASSNQKRNLMPAYLIQWEAMKLAKALGCTRYDFWGIPGTVDPETGDPVDTGSSVAERAVTGNGLWGVYRFKAGFGGRILSYDGAWDYVYSPWRYRLWTRVMPAVRGYWSRKAH